MVRGEDIGPDGMLFENGPTFITGTGQVIARIHPASACAGRPCVIHAPSDHRMREWPTNFRSSWDPLSIKPDHMERICPHGVGHPDPDDLAYRISIGEESAGVHGCDGCCGG
jgi:hypothetical protein